MVRKMRGWIPRTPYQVLPLDFFYQLTDPVYSTDAHTYKIVLPFDGKRALICLKLIKMVSEKGLE